jgi:hypothetical protein
MLPFVSKSGKVNLEERLVEGDDKVIEKYCLDYFQNCDFSSEYKIEAVCTDGLLKLFCGYFRGKYGIIEIELVGLYPAEIEEIQNNVIVVIQERLSKIPKKMGLNNFNYVISEGRIVLRFYACESGECEEREEILKTMNDFSPALEFLAEFLRRRKIRH